MSSRRGRSSEAEQVSRRCLEILDQMGRQLLAGGKPQNPERVQRLRADLAKLVHWAMHGHGNPDIIARINDCYRRCDLDLDDTTVLRLVRGTVKGELRKAGIDPAVPGLDPALDPPTIILTTKRTIQSMGKKSSTLTLPGPALDRKPDSAVAPPPNPPSTRSRRPAATAVAKAVSSAEMRAAFDRKVQHARELLERDGRNLVSADYLAAIYNDAGRKARFLDEIAAELGATDAKDLVKNIDGFFRDAFKGSYIERTDRTGNRRAHKR